MRTIVRLAWFTVATGCLLSGCRKGSNATSAETNTKAENGGAPDIVKLTMRAQAEAKIDVAPVELGVQVMPQRAKGHIALPDNATWRVGVLAEGRVEQVYSNLGDFVSKGQVLARMHSHDVHEARAASAACRRERSAIALEALAERNLERSQR